MSRLMIALAFALVAACQSPPPAPAPEQCLFEGPGGVAYIDNCDQAA